MLRACLMSLALVTTSIPATAQDKSPAPAAPYVAPVAPGELIDIGGRRLHIDCKGTTKGPTVIFEAGLSQFTAHSTYGRAQDLIAQFAQVCTYDRAGLGWSDAVAGPRTQADMVQDLHRLVRARRLTRPLVLVGHSMGGLLARAYAKDYPKDVVAVVLVDASPETVIFGAGAGDVREATITQIDTALKDAHEGTPVIPMPKGTAAETMLAFTPSILRTVKQEYQAIDLVPAAMRVPQGYGRLGRKPLVIVRRGAAATPPSEAEVSWAREQEALQTLSSNSTMIVANGAGHVIPYDQPAIVADAVRQALAMTRQGPAGK